MTREEAIQVLKSISAHNLNEVVDALYMAIEALQNPPISQRSMYQAGYKQGQEDRPKGEWVFDRTLEPHCSECNYVPDYSPRMDDYFFSDFCPNCGADMRATERNTNHSRETPTK